MNNRRQWRLGRIGIHLLLMCGGVWLGIPVWGWAGGVLASESPARLSIHAGRLSGQLTQVPLGAVLGQLKNQLHIQYVAPDAELRKRISVTLQKEPVSEALSKILAPWDYAFTLDAAGKIKIVYVMAKTGPEAPLAEMRPSGGKTEPHQQAVQDDLRYEGWDPERPVRPEDQLPKEVSLLDRSMKTRERTNKENFLPAAVQMEIRPPAPGTSMPILPPKGKDMGIIPGKNTQTMEIVPATAYPPMIIQPVQEHVKQEMLLTVKP